MVYFNFFSAFVGNMLLPKKEGIDRNLSMNYGKKIRLIFS